MATISLKFDRWLFVIVYYGQTTECHLKFVRGNFIWYDKISIIELPQRRFQAFLTYPIN